MTKSEERKILAQIVALIAESGEESYIQRTFAGICDICEQNIEDDFWISPVAELNAERDRNLKKDAEIGEKIRKLEFENHIMEEDTMRKTEIINQYKKIVNDQSCKITEIMEERDAMSDSVNGLQEILEKQDAEIVRLKAEIYDLRRELSK